MNSLRREGAFSLTVIAVCLASAVGIHAQVKTQSSTASGQPTTEVQVERGEVVRVDGNNLFIKMEDGSLRDFNNISEGAKIMVDGKELGIHDLKPGMKLQRTITTTTTPKTVTTVQTVTGKVWQVSPPNSVILQLEDGTTQKFNIPKDQKFTVNGEEKDAWGLRKGMKISATKVVEEPQSVVEHERQVTGTMPPPPTPPAPDQPILIAMVRVPAPARPQPSSPAPAEKPELPKTGSSLPLVGLLGALAVAVGIGLSAARRV
jgi:LPXTG-motif cell wall-anchored protein